MTNEFYSLQKRKQKNEFHLFIGKDSNGTVQYNSTSICKQLELSESESVLTDLPEDQARIKCANGGKQVCGTCVSELYSIFE